MIRSRSLAALCLAGLVVACPAEPRTTTQTPGTPRIGPQSPVGDELLDFVGEGEPLEPGRYIFRAFEPAMSFEVGEGWVGGHSLAEFFDVQPVDHPGSIVGFARPDFVTTEGGDRLDARGLSARRAIGEIRENEALGCSEAVLPAGGVEMPTITCRPDGTAELLGGPEGEFVPDGDSRLRVSALVEDGVLVMFVMTAPYDVFDTVAALGDEVYASVRFE